MPPVEVGEDDGGQIEGGQRQDAEHREEEEEMTVGNDHRPPVGTLELLDEQARRGHEGQAENEKTNRNEDTRKRHGLPPLIPALRTRTDYLRLRTVRLV